MFGTQSGRVFIEVATLKGRRAVSLDEQQPHSLRQLCLCFEESVEHPFPQVSEGTSGILPLPLIDQQQAVSSHIHKPFTALLNRHGRDLRIRHQNDLSHDAIISRLCVVLTVF